MLVDVGRIQLSGLLSVIPVREYNDVVLADLAARSAIPPSVNDDRAAEDAPSGQKAVIAESDVVHTSHETVVP